MKHSLNNVHHYSLPFVTRDAPVAHEQLTARTGRDLGFVRDEDDRAAFLVHRLEYLHDLFRRLRIEVAGRLIGHDDMRVIHKGPGDGDALPLAAGKLVRQMVCPVPEPDAL